VREIGLREANDAEIWRYALQQQAAIITKDEDFAERCLYSRDEPVNRRRRHESFAFNVGAVSRSEGLSPILAEDALRIDVHTYQNSQISWSRCCGKSSRDERENQ
jgi:Domain of unknown function (DUF5615)